MVEKVMSFYLVLLCFKLEIIGGAVIDKKSQIQIDSKCGGF